MAKLGQQMIPGTQNQEQNQNQTNDQVNNWVSKILHFNRLMIF